MSQIDKYIAKATAGLPSRERIDTSAELRVHLNAQIKKHMLEGHNQEEAEFLAVDAMGAVAPVNRQFLGHLFTPQLGWRLVALALIAIAGWFGINKLLEPKAGIYQVNTNTNDLMLAMRKSFYSFEFVAPENARSIRYFWAAPNQAPYTIYGNTFNSDTKIRYTVTLNHEYKCPEHQMAAISTIETRHVGKLNENAAVSATAKPSCVLQKKKPNSSFTYGAVNQPNRYAINTWYPIFKVQPSYNPREKTEDFLNPKNHFTIFVMFSNKDGSQGINPPEISEGGRLNGLRTLPEQVPNSVQNTDILVPSKTKSILIVGSSNQLRYSGYSIDLATRNNIKKLNFWLDHRYNKQLKSCLGTNWDIQFSFNPGERNINLCQNTFESPFRDFQKDEKLYGEFISRLFIMKFNKLDQWIPIYIIPNYDKNQIENPQASKDVNSWYILQVKFSSKRIPEGKMPFPNDLPKYKLTNPFDYHSLEAVK